MRDADGNLRVLYRTPGWEDFVLLAVTEIRQYGAQSIQIARRMRAMLESLIGVLPAARAEFLRGQMKLLHYTVERSFADPADRACAETGDLQGVGGSADGKPRGGAPQRADEAASGSRAGLRSPDQ